MAESNQEWEALIPSCFGIADLKFARHPLDEARAKSMIKEARKSGSSSEEIIETIRAFLVTQGASSAHIEDELQYAWKLMTQ